MNIIILDENYEFLTQLESSQIKINIVKEEDKFDQLELIYSPIDEDDYVDALNYFDLGHKVFIYENSDENIITLDNKLNNNGLYVMNSHIKGEYYEKNRITVVCEDVITELNNHNVILQWNESGIYDITDENVNRWFAPYNCIIFKNLQEEVTRNKVQIVGSINRINLLRKIEKITGLKAITNYEQMGNKITKNLYFLEKSDIGNKEEEFIEVGYNSESLAYEIDESDSYNSMNPIFKVSDNSEKVKNFGKIARGWLDLEIKKGQRVAYELDRSPDDKSVPIYTKSFFNKDKGSTCIYTNANLLNAPKIYEKDGKIINKSGSVEISAEMDKKDTLKDYLEVIFSKCAKELEKHLMPKITLDLDIKNKINKTYHLYDRLFVKVPFRDQFLKAYVSKISYNPLNPIEAQIEVKTDDSNLNKLRKDTKINLSYERKGKNTYEFKFSLIDMESLNRLKKPIHRVTIRSAQTYHVKRKVKNKNYNTRNKKGTITITCKPSCSFEKPSSKWRTRTWLNSCPKCGGKLSINPKHVPEREITCTHCDIDFCGSCGREKLKKSRWKLIAAKRRKTKDKKKYTVHTVKRVRKGFVNNRKIMSDPNKDLVSRLKLEKGKYKIIIYFEGDDEYGESKAEIKLTVK